MAFMMKKKKYKFTVELCLEEITAVTFLNGVLFAKLRLLDGGFVETSSREEIQEHKVRWGAKFEFLCKMSANASTGVLDPCKVRISVRKELKGGRSFQKLGFTDINLAEFAGSGVTQKKYLLQEYDTRHRQDNSMLSVTIRMNMVSGDILFKVPSPSLTSDSGPIEETVERSDNFSDEPMVNTTTAFSSLPKIRTPLISNEMIGTGPGDGVAVGAAAEENTSDGTVAVDEGLEMGHSRNSSSTSQMSRGSGYGSLQSQHSRQSSSGDSGHIRNSCGGGCLSETGSLDRGKAALERRKKAAEEGVGMGLGSARVEVTRMNPESLIDQLLKTTNLDHTDETSETSGLALYIAEDGTAAVGSREVKSQMTTGGAFKQVVIEQNR